MSKRKTTKEFVEQAKSLHVDKYDYSKVEYVNNSTKVCIICPIHGEFWQSPANHLKGKGCPKCCGKNKTTEEFIEQARRVHGGKYGYSKVEYTTCDTKICIICPKHGIFWQRPNDHLNGKGCPTCARLATSEAHKDDKQAFVEKAQAIHGDYYCYDLVDYVSSQVPVCIICPIHGEFWQTPNTHLTGSGCRRCYNDSLKVLVFGVGVNDTYQAHKTEAYRRWRHVLYRCYCEDFLNGHPTYKGCYVCEEWKHFSKFNEWFKKHHVEGWALDKDLLVENNKLYSPETCCFIPFEINAIFRSDVSENTKVKRSRDLAEKYKSQLEPKVYERLCNYGQNE